MKRPLLDFRDFEGKSGGVTVPYMFHGSIWSFWSFEQPKQLPCCSAVIETQQNQTPQREACRSACGRFEKSIDCLFIWFQVDVAQVGGTMVTIVVSGMGASQRTRTRHSSSLTRPRRRGVCPHHDSSIADAWFQQRVAWPLSPRSQPPDTRCHPPAQPQPGVC